MFISGPTNPRLATQHLLHHDNPRTSRFAVGTSTTTVVRGRNVLLEGGWHRSNRHEHGGGLVVYHIVADCRTAGLYVAGNCRNAGSSAISVVNLPVADHGAWRSRNRGSPHPPPVVSVHRRLRSASTRPTWLAAATQTKYC